MAAGGPRLDQRRRRQLALSYLQGSQGYDRVRPGYPDDAVDWLIPEQCRSAADVGAGTGKFTLELRRRGLDVTAVDPSPDMLSVLKNNLPQVTTLVGTAEETGLADSSVELVSIAQAWHWVDPPAAAAEAARILTPGGRLGLIWNQLDVSLPWVHRLSRIMHAGDVFRPDYRPAVGPLFTGLESQLTRWTQPLSPAELIDLAKSRSFYLAAGSTAREKVVGNLQWYLHEHLGFTQKSVVELPYVTYCWRATRS